MKPTLAILSVAATLLFAGKASALLLPLPPYVCVGRIVNYEQLNIAVLDDNATIAVYKTDGTLLARSNIAVITDSVHNYRLMIPMASEASPSAAVYGEALKITVVYAGKTYTSLNGFSLENTGEPGSLHEHDLLLFEDADGNGVADDYETIIEQLMAALGVQGSYNPTADYDGDGVSNYDEYVAGTNPFDRDDCFAVTAFGPDPENSDLLRLSFLTARAKTYQLRAGDTLSQNTAWDSAKFRETQQGNPVSTYGTDASTPNPIEKTIYIPKTQGEAATRFFRIRIQ